MKKPVIARPREGPIYTFPFIDDGRPRGLLAGCTDPFDGAPALAGMPIGI